MSKIFVVARREFFEVVKTKAFLIGSVFMPLLILGFMFGAEKIAKLAEREQMPTRAILLLDRSGAIAERLSAQVDSYNQENPNRKFELQPAAEDATSESLRARVAAGEAYAFLVIPDDVLSTGEHPCELGRKDSQIGAGRQIQKMINAAVIAARFESADPPIDIARIMALQSEVGINQVDVKSGQETSGDDMARVFTPFAFMFLLFMGTFSISQGLLTSVIEEKSSRVVEVLLSAVSPSQLMTGKILGMVTVGALLLAIWAAVGYVSASSREMGYLVTPFRLIICALYFVPGFLLFSSFLAAIGSACNTVKDAQSMASPLTIITIIPVMLWWTITENPSSMMAVWLSFLPPATPFVMILRICADPDTPAWQIVATLATLWASVIAALWFAGKVFRIGVLMYGKPPSLFELVRWVRYA